MRSVVNSLSSFIRQTGQIGRLIYGVSIALLLVIPASAYQWPVEQTKGHFKDKFRQLEEILPTPNIYRNASGAPGFAYWQQRADYKIAVSLDEEARRITGSETITYLSLIHI